MNVLVLPLLSSWVWRGARAKSGIFLRVGLLVVLLGWSVGVVGLVYGECGMGWNKRIKLLCLLLPPPPPPPPSLHLLPPPQEGERGKGY